MTKLKVNEAWKELLIRELKKGQPMNLAAKRVRVGLDRVHYARAHDEEFDCEVQLAIDNASPFPSW